jgi:N-acetylglucosaminyldiphosphoundecaprenol N-acetyl-beta-D-mannosaminyltransferase
VADVRLAVCDLEAAADLVIDRARRGAGGYACLCNAHVLVTAHRDDAVRRALQDAWAVYADGAPVAWLQRRLGSARARRVAGPDLMPRVIERGVRDSLGHFLFGSTEPVLRSLRRNLMTRFPDARFVGWYAPPLDRELDVDCITRIRAARPDVIWCALGAPKQELWMSRYAADLEPALLLGVGAAFDFHAGVKPRAPSWMQASGLEWLHRLASEPRRLGRRYVGTNSRFLLLAASELAQRRPA